MSGCSGGQAVNAFVSYSVRRRFESPCRQINLLSKRSWVLTCGACWVRIMYHDDREVIFFWIEICKKVRRFFQGVSKFWSGCVENWEFLPTHPAFFDTPGCVVIQTSALTNSTLPGVSQIGKYFSQCTLNPVLGLTYRLFNGPPQCYLTRYTTVLHQ